VSADGALNCGHCGAPMRALRLPGHYGQPVEIDLCAACHLVWFDAVESARLTGPALLTLIGAMAAAQTLAHRPLNPAACCPRCRGGLKTVHNRSRWGRSLQLECRQGHGAYQSFAQFLAEKGLVRPLWSADRARLLAGRDDFPCVNCGGPVAAADDACRWCTSVPGLFDVARLAQALDPEGATEAHAVHRSVAASQSLHCLACGAPSAPALACGQCGATLATPRLADAHRALSALGPALREHAGRPAAHVVKRRLAELSSDLERRREWAAQMQAEADARRGAVLPDSEDDEGRPFTPVHLAAAALLGLLLWWLFG
jgi:cytochrome c2